MDGRTDSMCRRSTSSDRTSGNASMFWGEWRGLVTSTEVLVATSLRRSEKMLWTVWHAVAIMSGMPAISSTGWLKRFT